MRFEIHLSGDSPGHDQGQVGMIADSARQALARELQGGAVNLTGYVEDDSGRKELGAPSAGSEQPAEPGQEPAQQG
jgi:hypothetical protein